jgi:hypothetical protein
LQLAFSAGHCARVCAGQVGLQASGLNSARRKNDCLLVPAYLHQSLVAYRPHAYDRALAAVGTAMRNPYAIAAIGAILALAGTREVSSAEPQAGEVLLCSGSALSRPAAGGNR